MSHTNSKRFNQKQKECCWPVTIGSRKCVPCNFTNIHMTQPEKREDLEKFGKNIDFDRLNDILAKYNIIFGIIKSGSFLYHGTLSIKNNWWEKSEHHGSMVWFTTDEEHQKNIPKSHTIKYMTTRPLLCLFEKNIASTYYIKNGQEYYNKIYTTLRLELLSTGIKIDGYVGCNECEIGLENVKNIIRMINVTKNSLKFID